MRVLGTGGGGRPPSRGRLLTLPNALSLLRLAALPLIFTDLVTGHLVRALLVGFVFGATDWIDGYLARRLDQVSDVGRLLDPIADRAFVVVVGLGYVLAGIMPWWAVALVFARDVVVLAVGGVLLLTGRRPPAVTRVGKAATFGLMWALGFFLLAAVLGGGPGTPQPAVHALAWFTFAVNAVLYYVAAGQYARTVLTPPPPPHGDGDIS